MTRRDVIMHAEACALLMTVVMAACGGDKSPAPSTAAPASSEDWFVERAKETGLDFVHFNGMSGEVYYPEIMAPGVGAVRLRQRRRPRRLRRPGPDARQGKTLKDATFPPQGALEGPPVPQRPDVARRRHADAAVHRRDGAERHRRADLRHGRRRRRLSTTTAGWTSIAPASSGCGAAAQQRQRHLHRHHGEEPAPAIRDGWGVSAVVRRLRSRRLARSLRRQLPDLQHRRRHRLPERDRPARLLSAEQLSRAAEPPVSQSRQRHVRGRDVAGR